jgi:glycosyltransferase involved in cell wall biosynthesis
MSLRVLYIHVIGEFGGASRSLFEAVRALPEGSVTPAFVTARGTVEPFFARLGPVWSARGISKFDHTWYGRYRGARWLVPLRELAYLPSTVCVLWTARRQLRGVDIIHLNEVTGLFVLWLAKRWLLPRATVVHVRSLADSNPRLRRTRLMWKFLRNRVDAVVAIDENVRASLPPDLRVDVIHNAFTPRIADQPDPAIEAAFAKLRPGAFKVGFVGNLLRVKGIEELVEAARITRDAGLDVEFVIVGDDAVSSRGLRARVLKWLGLKQNMRADVEAMLDRYALRDRVHLVGFTADIARVYQRMDVLCFPSHYDAPGRPIFEAAFFGVPSIVAVRDPKPDTLVDGVTGIAIAPRDANQLAAAITRLAGDREATRCMGEAARNMATDNFDATRNAARLLSVYKRITGQSG